MCDSVARTSLCVAGRVQTVIPVHRGQDLSRGTLRAIDPATGAVSGSRMVEISRTKNYVAVFERDRESDAWLVHIKGIEACHTYGRTLRQAEVRIREALAAWLDREPDELVITPQWPEELVKVATEVSAARRGADKASHDAAAKTTRAVKRLERMGLSRRDAADVLGISHQRVQQLLAS
jgi:predicted RNase H-like HicB family nuclease